MVMEVDVDEVHALTAYKKPFRDESSHVVECSMLG